MKRVGLLFAVALHALTLSNPPLVSYSTYLGPSSGSNSVAVDPAGYLYVSGIVEAPGFHVATCRLRMRNPMSGVVR